MGKPKRGHSCVWASCRRAEKPRAGRSPETAHQQARSPSLSGRGRRQEAVLLWVTSEATTVPRPRAAAVEQADAATAQNPAANRKP